MQINIVSYLRQAGKAQEDPRTTMRSSKLNFVDLSGNERGAVDEANPKLVEEANQINKSLFSLSKCINALSNPRSGIHVPYRDSKLTRFLRDSLSGTTKTVMVCHIAPCFSRFKDSIATLKYAEMAKLIPVNQKETAKQFKEIQEQEYKRMVQELRKELDQLKVNQEEQTQLAQGGSAPPEARLPASKKSESQLWQDGRAQEAEALLAGLRELYDEQINIKKNLCDVEAQNKMNRLISSKRNQVTGSLLDPDEYINEVFDELQQNTRSNNLARETIEQDLLQNQKRIEELVAELRGLSDSDAAKKAYKDIIRQKQQALSKLEVETSVRVYEEMNALLIDKVLGMRSQIRGTESSKLRSGVSSPLGKSLRPVPKGNRIDLDHGVIEMQAAGEGESQRFGFAGLEQGGEERKPAIKRDLSKSAIEDRLPSLAARKPQTAASEQGQPRFGEPGTRHRRDEGAMGLDLKDLDREWSEEEGALNDDVIITSQRIRRSIKADDVVRLDGGLRQRLSPRNPPVDYNIDVKEVTLGRRDSPAPPRSGLLGDTNTFEAPTDRRPAREKPRLRSHELSDSEANPTHFKSTILDKFIKKREPLSELQGLDSRDYQTNMGQAAPARTIDDKLYKEIMQTCENLLSHNGLLADEDRIPAEPLENPERVTNIKFGSEGNQKVRWNLNVVWGEEYKVYEGYDCDYPESWSMFEGEFLLDEADFQDALNDKELALYYNLKNKRPVDLEAFTNSRPREKKLPQIASRRSVSREPSTKRGEEEPQGYEEDFRAMISLNPNEVIYKQSRAEKSQEATLPAIHGKPQSSKETGRRTRHDRDSQLTRVSSHRHEQQSKEAVSEDLEDSSVRRKNR